MITLQTVTPDIKAQILGIQIDSEFVAPLSFIFDHIDGDQEFLPLGFFAAQQAVGFCYINFKRSDNNFYCFDNQTCGIQGFQIDERQQGKGYARQGMQAVIRLLQEQYPQYTSLNLTVNQRNQAAKQLYLKLGFQDTGDLYLGGSKGPQHIYTYDLSNKA